MQALAASVTLGRVVSALISAPLLPGIIQVIRRGRGTVSCNRGTAPLINAPVSGRNIQITGSFTRVQAQELAAQLQSGPCRSNCGSPPAAVQHLNRPIGQSVPEPGRHPRIPANAPESCPAGVITRSRRPDDHCPRNDP
jgi:hypothetical protein